MNPRLPRHAGTSQDGSAVERRIKRRVRSDREEEEEREDTQQEADQLIEPTGDGRSEDF